MQTKVYMVHHRPLPYRGIRCPRIADGYHVLAVYRRAVFAAGNHRSSYPSRRGCHRRRIAASGYRRCCSCAYQAGSSSRPNHEMGCAHLRLLGSPRAARHCAVAC